MCPTLCDPTDYSPWNSPGQITVVGSISLLQGIFPTPGIEPRFPALWADSLPAEPQGKPKMNAQPEEEKDDTAKRHTFKGRYVLICLYFGIIV